MSHREVNEPYGEESATVPTWSDLNNQVGVVRVLNIDVQHHHGPDTAVQM
jgi:hypothetical protein